MSDKSYLVNSYNRYPVSFSHGLGSKIFDTNGKEYLDFLSGIAVNSFGHSNAVIREAVDKQLEKVWHASNLFQIEGQEKVAKILCDRAEMSKAFFCNSGTEANEAAIKFARKYGNGKYEIITAAGSFHGRTMGALSATGQEKIWDGFFPVLEGFPHVAYDSIEAMQNAITDKTIAIMVEPIQGENGVVVPSENYLSGLRQLCDENNLLLILDEVQTGIGRTGKLFAYQYYGIVPDMVCFAKGIANGLPLGGVLVNSKVADCVVPGMHGSTFGGNPVALSAAEAVLGLLTDEMLSSVKSSGDKILDKVKALNNPLIKDARGTGLMIGIEIDSSIEVKLIAQELMNMGVVAGTSGNNTLRLLPPFIITDEDIEIFIQAFKQVLDNIAKREIK